MAEFPALPLFTDAFIADTTHLNATQTGAYLMLLIVAWRTKTGKLPNDDKILARYARMDVRSWKSNKDLILSFWKTDEAGDLYQDRLLDERENVAAHRRKNVEAGKASALKRKNRGSTNAPTKPQPKGSTLPFPSQSSPITTNCNNKTDIVGADLLGDIPEKNIKIKIKPHRLPDDWEPDIDLGEWAMAKGLTRSEVHTEIEAFKNHWKASAGKSSVKLDWDAAFRTWAINAVKFKTERKPNR